MPHPASATASRPAPARPNAPAARWLLPALLPALLLLASCGSSLGPMEALAQNRVPVAHAAAHATPMEAPLALALQATDADGDELSYEIVSAPAHGTLSGAAPQLTYTPDAGFRGTDDFAFRASDGHAASEAVTVTITVRVPLEAVDDHGVARFDAVLRAVDAGFMGFGVVPPEAPVATAKSLLWNDLAEDDELEVVAFDLESALGAAVSVNADGTFAYDPTGVAALAACGEHLDSFSYTVRDAAGAEDTATVEVTVAGGCAAD